MNLVKIGEWLVDDSVKEDKIVIIDADSAIHECAHPGKDDWGDALPEYTEEEYEIAEGKLSERILGILNTVEMRYNIIKHYVCIKGKGNFRYALYPPYKANRPKPLSIINHLCNYLRDNFDNVIVGNFAEADDYVYTLSKQINHDGVVCSIDKDLKQIPTLYYNYRTEEWFRISEEEARYNLAMQILVGDSGDGVNLTPKFGKVKASRVIEIGMSEYTLIRICCLVYKSIWGNQASEKLRLCHKLLKLKDMGNGECVCEGGPTGRTVTEDFKHQICDTCNKIRI